MATYFVHNIDNPATHSPEYPGVRIDAANEQNAAQAYANGSYGWVAGQRLRVIPNGPNFVIFFSPSPGPAVPGPAQNPPALPPVGS